MRTVSANPLMVRILLQLYTQPISDLKLYGRNHDQLKGLLYTVRTFSDDIQMKFGLGKCAVNYCCHHPPGRVSGVFSLNEAPTNPAGKSQRVHVFPCNPYGTSN